MKILILILVILVFIALFYSMFLMLKNRPEDAKKFNIALRFRVGLSITIIALLLISNYFDVLNLHGVIPIS